MNWLDIVIIVCIIIGIVHGLITGIVKQVLSLVSLIAAIFLSGAVANLIRQWIQPYMHDGNNWFSPEVQNAIFYILAFIIIISVFALLANLVDKIINFTPAGILNKMAGAIFGLFMWTLCLSILMNFISVFDTHSQLIPQQVKENSILYYRVNMIFPTIFPYIQDFFKH